MLAAEDVAVDGRDRVRNGRSNPGRNLKRIGDYRAAHHGMDGRGKRPADLDHRRERDRPFRSGKRRLLAGRHTIAGVAGEHRAERRYHAAGGVHFGGSATVRAADNESTTARVFLADQLQAGRHVFEPFDQHVLQQIAEGRFHRAFIARLDVDEIRQRAHLADLAVGVDEHHPRRVGKAAAMRLNLFERTQPRRHSGQVLLAGADLARSPFVFDARGGEV